MNNLNEKSTLFLRELSYVNPSTINEAIQKIKTKENK